MEHASGIRVRRSRAEWQRLVRQWQRSGQGAGEFGSAHGVDPRQLSWWRWHLANDSPPTKRAIVRSREPLRLVPVEIVDERPVAPRDETAAGWELVTAAGDRLTVRGAIEGRDLATLIAALLRRRR